MNSKIYKVQSPQKPTKFSVIKRVGNLVLVILGIIFCVNLWLLNSEHADNWHKHQSNQLGQSLAEFSARLLAPLIVDKAHNKIHQHLNELSIDPNIIQVSLFDPQGKDISGSLPEDRPEMSIRDYFNDNSPSPVVFVQPIYTDGNIIGYLRLLLEKQKVLLYHQAYQEQIFKQMTLALALAVVIGMLIARGFYKVRRRLEAK